MMCPMTHLDLRIPQKTFALFSAYLILSTNFVGAFRSRVQHKINNWEEFQQNELLRRSVFRPSRPCCDNIEAIQLDLLRSGGFRPPPRHQRPFLVSPHRHRRPSLIQRVRDSTLESLGALNPFRRPIGPSRPPQRIQNGFFPLQEEEEEELNHQFTQLQNPQEYGPEPPPPSPSGSASTYARFLSWLSKFRPSKVSNIDKDSSSSGELPLPGQNVSLRPPLGTGYSFQDVLSGIRRNESSGLLLKKFLSAASALSERSGSDPGFMLWTIPTTLFAFLGVFYFLGAVLILGYKYVLFANDSANGQAVSLLPVLISFLVPIGLATLFVTSRGILNGKISPSQVVRGDSSDFLRHDFDPLHFGLDATFGTFTLLGIGWLVSIAV